MSNNEKPWSWPYIVSGCIIGYFAGLVIIYYFTQSPISKGPGLPFLVGFFMPYILAIAGGISGRSYWKSKYATLPRRPVKS